jgi:CRP-like cAMP-binding protein
MIAGARRRSVSDIGAVDAVPLSETDDLEAEDLLRNACFQSPFLAQMNAGDIQSLASTISIVDFQEGEQVMAKGQTATWVGIVLSGELAALVNGAVVGKMGVGKIVGDLSFFTGGIRHADVEGHETGFIAFIMTQNLLNLIKSAPSTGTKLLRAFGKSSLYQISHNPREHAPLSWNLSGQPLAMASEGWQADHFDVDEYGIEPEDAGALIGAIKCHKFQANELLIDRFADNEGCICFVISGTVRAELNGVHMRTFGEGSFLHDLHFFDKTLLPYNIIGNEPGVLGSVNADAIESLAVSRPLLALAFMRRIGNSAVRTIREDAILERNDTSTIKKNQSAELDAREKEAAERAASATTGADDGATSLMSERSSENAAPVKRKLQRRGSVKMFMPKQGGETEGDREVEVFHKNKLEAQAKRSNHNKILAHKFEREAKEAAEELAQKEESKKGLERALARTRDQVASLKESEAHFTKLFFAKQKELERTVLERDSLYRELDELRQASGTSEADETTDFRKLALRLQGELDASQVKLKEFEERLSVSVGTVNEQLEKEKRRCEERLQKERRAMQEQLSAVTTQLATRESDLNAWDKARAGREEQQAERNEELMRALEEMQTDKMGVERTVTLQRVAAKALAVGYATKLALLRRQVRTLTKELDAARTGIAELPARNSMLERKNTQLEEEVTTLRASIEPLKDEMAQARTSERRASMNAVRLSSQEAAFKLEMERLQQQMAQAQEQATFFSDSLIKAQLSSGQATARASKLAKTCETTERELVTVKQERDALRASVSQLLSKMANFEAGFGPLLEPKPAPNHSFARASLAHVPGSSSRPSPRPSPRYSRAVVSEDHIGEAFDGPVLVATRSRLSHSTSKGRAPQPSPRFLLPRVRPPPAPPHSPSPPSNQGDRVSEQTRYGSQSGLRPVMT